MKSKRDAKYKCDKKLRIYSARPSSQYSSKNSVINSTKKSKNQQPYTKTQKSKNYYNYNNMNFNNSQLNRKNINEDYYMNYTKDYRNLDKMIKDYMGDYEKMVQKKKLIKIPENIEKFNFQEYENKQKKFRIMFDEFINYNAEEDNINANKLIENISDELDCITILKNANTRKDYEMRIENDELQKKDSQDQLNQNCYINENEAESEGGLNDNNNKISEHSNENENINDLEENEEDELEKKEDEKNYIKEKENNKSDKEDEKNSIKENENNKSDKEDEKNSIKENENNKSIKEDEKNSI